MDDHRMNTAGFYDSLGNWGPHFVAGPSFELFAESKDTYTYPVDGWTWYDSVEEAQAAEGFDPQIVQDINETVYGVQEDA